MWRWEDHEREFTAWAAARQSQLIRTAYLLSGDVARAEDLVQEALVKVAVRWPKLENPDAFARTVLVRDNVSWWRRHRRELPVAETVEPQPGAGGHQSEDALVVRRALARLTPSQRAVVVLRHLEDLGEREVADILGVAVGTVKSQNAAALARLRTGAPELLDLIGRTS